MSVYIRTQIKDILKWLRRNKCTPPYTYNRGFDEKEKLGYWANEPSVQEMFDRLKGCGVPWKDIYLDSDVAYEPPGMFTEEYEVRSITAGAYRKQTDREYFDFLSEIIRPTEYDMGQYNQYLALKAKYEGTDNESE